MRYSTRGGARPLTPRQRLGRVLPDRLYRSLKYRQAHGVWPSLSTPRRYTEKVNWRILYDRNEDLVWTCDKLAGKAEAARRRPDIRFPAVVWTGTDVADLAEVALPERWILKPNNSSGRAHFGTGQLDAAAAAALAAETADWLDRREFVRLREWAYSKARPVFLVEAFIGAGPMPPTDHKIFVFDGVVRLILVSSGRYGPIHVRTFFSADWEPTRVDSMEPSDPGQSRPANLERLLAVAADLGRGFDHVRVDLYNVDGEIWFGEYASYPWSGHDRILPVEVDLTWGDHWRLPRQ